jgi:hypothetical protein
MEIILSEYDAGWPIAPARAISPAAAAPGAIKAFQSARRMLTRRTISIRNRKALEHGSGTHILNHQT